MKLLHLGMLAVVLFSFFAVPALALEEDDLEIFGIELEKALNLGSSILAFVLSGLLFVAYKRSKKERLLFIMAAFILFGIKTFFMGAEIFFGEWPWVDITTSLMDFVILLTFFVGIMKR